MIESGWFEGYIGVAGGAIGAACAKLALVHIGMAAHAGRGQFLRPAIDVTLLAVDLGVLARKWGTMYSPQLGGQF